MEHNYLDVVKAYAKHLREKTGTQVIILPSEVNSERFHVELSILPHPVVEKNGRARVRIRATVAAEIPASEVSINDCLKRSFRLALYFDFAQGFPIIANDANGDGVCGIAYHTALRDDDDLFSDLGAEDRSYSYNESWLVELEFDLSNIKGGYQSE